MEGENPVRDPALFVSGVFLKLRLIKLPRRVGLPETAALNGWKTPSKAKYRRKTDSIQVPRGKDAKNSEERVKSA